MTRFLLVATAIFEAVSFADTRAFPVSKAGSAAYDAYSENVFVTAPGKAITVISTARDAIIGTVPGTAGATHAVNQGGKILAIAPRELGGVLVQIINPRALRIDREIEIPMAAVPFSVNRVGQDMLLFRGQSSRVVQLISVGEGRVLKTLDETITGHTPRRHERVTVG